MPSTLVGFCDSDHDKAKLVSTSVCVDKTTIDAHTCMYLCSKKQRSYNSSAQVTCSQFNAVSMTRLSCEAHVHGHWLYHADLYLRVHVWHVEGSNGQVDQGITTDSQWHPTPHNIQWEYTYASTLPPRGLHSSDTVYNCKKYLQV